MRRFLAALTVAVAACAIAAAAHAQCTYPVLTDDVAQTFATTPTYARFTQSAGRWAGAAVRSSGTANWDVGFSTGTMAFPSCLTIPVVASQQSSGVDFVIGDFATQGTGTRYAPIARSSGTGSGTLEWDSGSRTAVIGAVNFGNGGANLIDVWNVNLVAGKSYSIFLSGNTGEFILYAFQRMGANTWRQKSDAVLVVGSQYSGPWVFTPTVTGSYPLVVVNDANSASFYAMYLEECADPPFLNPFVEQLVPAMPGHWNAFYKVMPNDVGFPTVAVRPTEGEITSIGVGPRSAPGAYPACDYHPTNSTNADLPVELVVGDFASGSIPGSGALPVGGTYWIGLSYPAVFGNDTWVQFDPGHQIFPLNGPALHQLFLQSGVVRTCTATLSAGQDVIVHAANCGPSVLKLWIFRWFDASVPFGGGWSSNDNHPPLVTYEVQGIEDYTFTPPVDGPYAFILTKETAAGAGCAELALSTCKPRLELSDGLTATLAVNPILSYAGQPCGTLHAVDETWSAIAVRPNAANENWDIDVTMQPSISNGGAPPPLQCLGSTIEKTHDNGSGSRIDFIVRSGRYVPSDPAFRVLTERVYPVGSASPGGGARVEFASATSDLVVGAPPVPHFVHAGQLVGIWNVDLAAGTPYTIWFDPKQTGAELFLFKDWDPCAGCLPHHSYLGGPGQVLRASGPTTFTPDWSGKYALLVVNQNAAQDTMKIGVFNQTVGVGEGPASQTAISVPRFEAVAPNPVRAGTALQFSFALPRPARVAFEVVDLAGRIVARTQDADSPAGTNRRAWTLAATDGRSLAPGVYFARMWVDGAPVARKKLSITR
jgi:hypothetical protein